MATINKFALEPNNALHTDAPAGRAYRREAALHLGLLRRPVAVRVPLIGETVSAEQKLAFRSDRKLLSVGRVT